MKSCQFLILSLLFLLHFRVHADCSREMALVSLSPEQIEQLETFHPDMRLFGIDQSAIIEIKRVFMEAPYYNNIIGIFILGARISGIQLGARSPLTLVVHVKFGSEPLFTMQTAHYEREFAKLFPYFPVDIHYVISSREISTPKGPSYEHDYLFTTVLLTHHDLPPILSAASDMSHPIIILGNPDTYSLQHHSHAAVRIYSIDKK